jgi:O-acetyl-ADP-ribose deacetylase (regulator of RNase III)
MIERLIVVTRDLEGSRELQWSMRSCPAIEVFLGSFTDIPEYDCMATAGNSFGLMDAGIDLAIVKYFGIQIQNDIQNRILTEYLGEQPVGTALLVRTLHPMHKWVAHSPTMRIPMNIEGTDNIYLAAWATLLEVEKANRRGETEIRTLVMPAFGTGTGGVSHLEAGTQIRLAVEHYLKPARSLNGTLAQNRQEKIHYGGRHGFLHPRKIE